MASRWRAPGRTPALRVAMVAAILAASLRPAVLRDATAASRPPARGAHGMVVSVSEIASQVGVDVLRRGGKAGDAAVAVGLALSVVWPAAGNLGGGGFMLVRLADGRSTAIDYREMAPAAAHHDVYLAADGRADTAASRYGPRASGVPGTVAGLAYARRTCGTLAWADLVEPARRLAAEGFPVGRELRLSMLRDSLRLSQFAETRRIFLRNGRLYLEGEVFRQPELAATLERLKLRGPQDFYHGRTAELIVHSMKGAGNWITAGDLAAYRVIERAPLTGRYRGVEILTMPPPSSGGVALLEMLHMLERYDLRAMGAGSSQALHLMIEAMRRAYADRAEFLGDPDFVAVPVKGLTARSYAEARAADITATRASTSGSVGHGEPARHESEQT